MPRLTVQLLVAATVLLPAGQRLELDDPIPPAVQALIDAGQARLLHPTPSVHDWPDPDDANT